MKEALGWVAVALVGVAMLGVVMTALGSWRWTRGTRRLLARLEGARQLPATLRYDVREIAGLPAPVQRFFRSALQDGQRVVTAVSVEHVGSMNMGGARPRWKRFTSSQRVLTRRPGFDWDARIALLPGIAMHIHDAYIAGAGVLRGAVGGIVPVVNTKDSPELASGELLRFLAECAWYPTALLPSQGVRWTAVDDQSAIATLTDGPVTAALTFHFQQDGAIDSVRAESRGRAVGKATIGTPWQGRFWNHQMQAGMRVPMEGEVAWILPEGPMPYWRGVNTELRYEFAR